MKFLAAIFLIEGIMCGLIATDCRNQGQRGKAIYYIAFMCASVIVAMYVL